MLKQLLISLTTEPVFEDEPVVLPPSVDLGYLRIHGRVRRTRN